ncbi:hypothetical protein [Coleofasciculus sp.]
MQAYDIGRQLAPDEEIISGISSGALYKEQLFLIISLLFCPFLGVNKL